MALENSGTIGLSQNFVALGYLVWKLLGGTKILHRPTHTQTHIETQTHIQTHTHRGVIYKSCFSAKMQKQD